MWLQQQERRMQALWAVLILLIMLGEPVPQPQNPPPYTFPPPTAPPPPTPTPRTPTPPTPKPPTPPPPPTDAPTTPQPRTPKPPLPKTDTPATKTPRPAVTPEPEAETPQTPAPQTPSPPANAVGIQIAPRTEMVAMIIELFDAPALLFHVTAARTTRLALPRLKDVTERHRLPYVDGVEDTLREQVQPTVLGSRSYYFLLVLEDGLSWGADEAWRDRYDRLHETYPNLFFLTSNAMITDPETGYIGQNVIPIPDMHPWGGCGEKTAYTPCARRKPGLVWRGATTGWTADGGEYAASDRYRAVEALANSPVADVKFSRFTPNVAEDEVPKAFRGKPATAAETALYQAQLDVDGDVNSWSLRDKFCARTPVVKVNSERWVQWYYPSLVNGRHLVVVSADMKDLSKSIERVVGDHATCDEMAFVIEEFYAKLSAAQNATSGDTARLGLASILRSFRTYTEPRDWRIQGTKGLRRGGH
eukprot:TRINITY_DN10289_c0_g1_i3.p1 TRINITY_DN10289_c0_g1~~TRINITY_DN10289_c0_g1_i3.p1  ORF type:complete len:475 (+),score=76.41 TRINITY_DN10289_c0_g1_i3:65-1489(+)